MTNNIYFCVFCRQKFNKNDENVLKKHLISRHFNPKPLDPFVVEWIESLVTYQKDLNHCLSLDPKSLPKSMMCQSEGRDGKQKLLKGCSVCDQIILCFKLDVEYKKKNENLCICGEGKEVKKAVVFCIQCNHMFHYPCVEPTDYSGL